MLLKYLHMKNFFLEDRNYMPIMPENSHAILPSYMFFFYFSSFLIPLFHCYFCPQWFVSFLPLLPLIALIPAHSQHIPSLSSFLSSQPLHHFIFAYLSPITPSSPLTSSFHLVPVQLQKWDLAVTNLLAKPPRAPCGGASSQRTRVIDWTWGKLCQAGHHDWISCLIINSLLSQVLWGDTSVMWRIFMTHGALDC